MDPQRLRNVFPCFAVAVCAAVATLGFSGCQTTDGVGDMGHYEVSVKSAPFYSYWSGRSSGPDFCLPKGTHLVGLKREFGYSRVVTDAGLLGYVSPADMKPALPRLPSKNSRVDFAALQRLPWGGGRSGLSSANGRAVMQDGSLFGGNDLPPLSPRDPLQPGNFSPGFRVSVSQRKMNEPGVEAKAPTERKPPARTKPGTEDRKPGFRVSVPTRHVAEQAP